MLCWTREVTRLSACWASAPRARISLPKWLRENQSIGTTARAAKVSWTLTLNMTPQHEDQGQSGGGGGDHALLEEGLKGERVPDSAVNEIARLAGVMEPQRKPLEPDKHLVAHAPQAPQANLDGDEIVRGGQDPLPRVQEERQARQHGQQIIPAGLRISRAKPGRGRSPADHGVDQDGQRPGLEHIGRNPKRQEHERPRQTRGVGPEKPHRTNQSFHPRPPGQLSMRISATVSGLARSWTMVLKAARIIGWLPMFLKA